MRRALVVLAALVVVAGAFTAGALIFRSGNESPRNIVEAEIRCSEGNCRAQADQTVQDGCAFDDTVDGVKITVVYETRPNSRLLPRDAPVEAFEPRELGRRTYTKDC